MQGMTLFAKSGRRRRAFTLVEICLSLGIMTFAVTAMLGLLPVSLNQLTSAEDRNQAQRIVQQVIVEAQQTRFSTLAGAGTYQRYFTNEAQVTQAGNAAVVYAAVVSVSKDARTGTASALPGGDPAPTMAKLRITVCKALPSGVLTNVPVASYVTLFTCDDLSDYNAADIP